MNDIVFTLASTANLMKEGYLVKLKAENIALSVPATSKVAEDIGKTSHAQQTSSFIVSTRQA